MKDLFSVSRKARTHKHTHPQKSHLSPCACPGAHSNTWEPCIYLHPPVHTPRKGVHRFVQTGAHRQPMTLHLVHTACSGMLVLAAVCAKVTCHLQWALIMDKFSGDSQLSIWDLKEMAIRLKCQMSEKVRVCPK